MNSLQIVKEVLSTMEKGDFENLKNLLHEEYQLIGPTPKIVGKQEFLDMFRSLKTGFPDWAFNATDLEDVGDQVTGRLHVTGKQTGPLDLSFMGLPTQAATGIKIKQPEEPMTATIRDGKLYRFEVAQVEGSGVEGLLRQIGVSIPAHA